MKPDLSVNIAGINFKNPVMDASGTFGSGIEYSEYMNIGALGAIVTKGVSPVPWEGNPTPRIAETPSGMLNAIGLQNPGVDLFLRDDLPFLLESGTEIIVNVCGHSQQEYLEVVERLNETKVSAYEINVSCPNVKAGGIAFGTDSSKLYQLTESIVAISKKPVIIKLSPNVTDITEMARAAQEGGADAVSLINTLLGMKIDIHSRRFVLANKTGGLSGPAVHPVAVRMVYQVAQAVDIPIIGCGGIMDYEGAIEMMLAGASAVMVGTANFHKQDIMIDIIDGIQKYLEENNIKSIKEIIGAAI